METPTKSIIPSSSHFRLCQYVTAILSAEVFVPFYQIHGLVLETEPLLLAELCWFLTFERVLIAFPPRLVAQIGLGSCPVG